MLIWVSSKIIPLQSREAINFSLKAKRDGLGTIASHLQIFASRHNGGPGVTVDGTRLFELAFSLATMT